MAFLHYQERKLRNKPNSADGWSNAYYMPGWSWLVGHCHRLSPVVSHCAGEADRSIGAWRQWLAKARCVEQI